MWTSLCEGAEDLVRGARAPYPISGNWSIVAIAGPEGWRTYWATDRAQNNSVGVLRSIESFVGQRGADGINGSLVLI